MQFLLEDFIYGPSHETVPVYFRGGGWSPPTHENGAGGRPSGAHMTPNGFWEAPKVVSCFYVDLEGLFMPNEKLLPEDKLLREDPLMSRVVGRFWCDTCRNPRLPNRKCVFCLVDGRKYQPKFDSEKAQVQIDAAELPGTSIQHRPIPSKTRKHRNSGKYRYSSSKSRRLRRAAIEH